MKAFFQLVRWKNLGIITLTMYSMRFFFFFNSEAVVTTNLKEHFDFFLLVASTVFIAAGGYSINDYFDVKTDALSHPNRPLVTGKLSRRFALKVHLISSVLGSLIGIYLLFVNHQLSVLFCQIFSILALIYYAAVLKRSFLVGNVTIALLTALVVWMTSAYLLNIASQLPLADRIFNRAIFFNFSWFFTIFSFGLTLVRELIKDMQDIEGDAFIEAKTFPILLGINKSKYFVISLLVLILVVLITQIKSQMHWADSLVRQLPLGGIGVIFLVAIYLLLSKQLSVVRLKWIDGSIKIAMVLGLVLPYYWKWIGVFN